MRVWFLPAIVLPLAFAPIMMAKDTDERLNAAADVLTDMMHASDKGIPQDLLNKSQCVVIVPGMKKGAFMVGAKYGRGFVMCRRASGIGWSAPAAIRVEGGSVGFQIGGSEQDVILLVMNREWHEQASERSVHPGRRRRTWRRGRWAAMPPLRRMP